MHEHVLDEVGDLRTITFRMSDFNADFVEDEGGLEWSGARKGSWWTAS